MKSIINSIKNGLHDIGYILKHEYRAVFKDYGVLLFFFALPFAYPILYASIYNPEVVREVPMVVVDNCRTPMSRELARRMDATPNAQIVSYCANLEEARRLMYEKKAHGILFVPEDFSKKPSRGEQGTVTFYSDMSILLNYKSFLIALTDVTLNMGTQLQVEGLSGATAEQISMATQPIPSSSITLYNPESGFASFLIPAILILILQQSLILGIGMLSGGMYEHHQMHLLYAGKHRKNTSMFHLVIGKAICYWSLYILPTVFMLHVIPYLFKFPQLGNQWDIYAFALPFLLSSIFFAMTLSVFVREREASFLLFVFTSLIFLFISGITWPHYAMPQPWRWLSYAVPSTFGIEGFVKINTNGSSIYDVSFAYTGLWILTGIYFLTTCLTYRYQIYRDQQLGYSGDLQTLNDKK